MMKKKEDNNNHDLYDVIKLMKKYQWGTVLYIIQVEWNEVEWNKEEQNRMMMILITTNVIGYR